METRFARDFEFCTSFYENFHLLIPLKNNGFVVEPDKISIIAWNHHKDNDNEILYKLSIEFSKNSAVIQSYYRELKPSELIAYQANEPAEIKHDHKIVQIQHNSFLSASIASKFPNLSKEYVVRIATYLTICRLEQYAVLHPEVKLPNFKEYKGTLSDNQKIIIEFLKKPSALVTHTINHTKSDKKTESAPKEKKRTCTIS